MNFLKDGFGVESLDKLPEDKKAQFIDDLAEIVADVEADD